MTLMELAEELKEMYTDSDDKVAMIHLFGIRYAKEIKENKYSPKEILRYAHMQESYVREIYKGVRLEKYVSVKPQYMN